MEKLFTLLILLGNIGLVAQNLVPNPSFEEKLLCQIDLGKLDVASNWTIPSNHLGTPDYFNTCAPYNYGFGVNVPYNNFGYQHAASGNAYIGLMLYAEYDVLDAYYRDREYAIVKLESPLEKGERYEVSFSYSVADRAKYYTSDLGLYFSKDFIIDPNFTETNLPYKPQITVDYIMTESETWISVKKIFTASGGERFMTVGNFKNDSETTILDEGAGYINGAYVYLDKFSVVKLDCPIEFADAFTPNGDNVNDYFGPILQCTDFETYEFQIMNRWGDIIFRTIDETIKWNGLIKGEKASPDTYMYYLNYKPAYGSNKYQRGYVTLIP